MTGRDEHHVQVVEAYCKANGLFYTPDAPEPVFTDVVEINLSEIETNLSGPKRPQDLIPLSKMKQSFRDAVKAPQGNQGFGLTEADLEREITVELNGEQVKLKTGAVVIAAITSCTNTSNPYVLVAAGLVAKKRSRKACKCRNT